MHSSALILSPLVGASCMHPNRQIAMLPPINDNPFDEEAYRELQGAVRTVDDTTALKDRVAAIVKLHDGAGAAGHRRHCSPPPECDRGLVTPSLRPLCTH